MMSDPLWINAGIGTLVGNAAIEADDETLTIASHGLNNGDAVFVDTLTGGAVGVLFENTVYFVRDETMNTFTLAGAEGGNIKPFATDGTANVYIAVPRYAANELRRAQAMFLTPQSSTIRFGSREGVRPHSLAQVSVAGTTWTVHDLVAVVDPRITSATGPYVVQHLEESGSLDPADGTNDRIDALDLQVQDDDEDASGFRRARIVYVVGTPAGSPSPPALTATSLRLGTVLVSAGGSPAPVVESLAQYTVASGGILPVRAGDSFPTAGVYEGAYADRDGALFRWTGTEWLAAASPNAPTMEVFTSPGNFTKASYPWARRVKVRVVGGGGSGGGCGATGSDERAASGGGGGGGYAEKWISVGDLSTSETVTIGAGGAAATAGNNDGNTGGTSAFGAHCSATGGSGGSGDAGGAGTVRNAGGTGGSGIGGDINVDGDAGGQGVRVGGTGGENALTRNSWGGGNPLAGLANSTASSQSNGATGKSYGGGSSGASHATNQSARPSTAGAAGVVIVEVH